MKIIRSGEDNMTMRVVTFKLDEDILEKLDRYARRTGRSRSEVIRQALERLLSSEEPMIARTYRIRIY